MTESHAPTIRIGGDLPVSRMGFGAMRITGPASGASPRDREVAKAVLRRPWSWASTSSTPPTPTGRTSARTLIAEALHPYPTALVIATKGGLDPVGPRSVDAQRSPRAPARSACEGSLRRLRLERITLYQLHRPDPSVPLEDSVGTLVELQERGQDPPHRAVERHRGQLARAQAITPIVSVQNRYNLADRDAEAAARRVRAGGLGLPAVGADPGARQATPALATGGEAPRRHARARSPSPGCWTARR